ncbi:putative galactinol--sucrose galactosyltransferase 5, partial [Cucurbita argyrosperma subsp. argyrosperma]
MAPILKNGNSNIVVSFDGLNDLSSPFSIDGSNFTVNGHTFLSDVPENIVASPSPYTTIDKSPVSIGCFVGFDVLDPDSRHVVSIGKLKDIKFMSIFRFKVWWTTHWVGRNGGDLESETQIVILEKSDSGRPYVLLLPLVEGPFRSSIQPGEDDFVDVCVESGSSKVVDSSFRSVLYLHAGIMEGVKHLVDGGCPPGLVLIDDGWQSIGHDADPITKEGMNQTVAGEQMPCRLLKFQENYKFRDYVNPKSSGVGSGQKGMKAFIDELKGEYKTVEYVYVWHALCGYWGGLRPNVPGLPEANVIQPVLSPGLQQTMEDLAVDKIVCHKVGIVPPEKAEEMYEGLHAHLENVGIDGVKIDVIHLLEMLCEDYGGRVDLAKAYYKAMSKSIKKHFKGNGVIASMEHCNDFMFLGTEAISLGRVGDDFWCTDPSGDPNGTFWLQGCHMVHCAYNSLWMGNFIHPDWDMFQSTHPCAAFHAASRAISGGPIYVSDFVGKHNFELLRKLVLPDGSILRSEYYALPTRDCLFDDPLHDGETMLKIWNLNKFTGVIGAFNCQGGGWCRETRRNQCFSQYSKRVTSKTNAKDIEWNSGENPISIEGVKTFALYLYQAKKLILAKPTQNIDIALDPFDFELIFVSPVTTLIETAVQFAPIGLVNMLNIGGAIQSVYYDDDLSSVEIGVKGTGEMRVYASDKPRACRIDGEDVGFKYQDQMVAVQVPWPGSSGISTIEYLF